MGEPSLLTLHLGRCMELTATCCSMAPCCYSAPPSSNKRSRGTAIGFDKNTRITLKAKGADAEGRYLFIKRSLFNIDYTSVNVYCPNICPTIFLKKVLNKLEGFTEGRLIVAGDFNFVFDPALDTQPLSLRSEGNI